MRRILGLLVILLSSTAWGQTKSHTKATLYLSEAAVKPGSTVTAALHLQMDPNWHTYWKNPGESGKATKITWELPPGITAGEIQWPVPEKFETKVGNDSVFTYVFHKEVALLIPLTIAADAPAGAVAIKGKANWLECEVPCIPGSARVEAPLVIGVGSKPSAQAEQIKKWEEKIPKAASDDLKLTAEWDGAGTAEERAIIFALTKDSGAWEFYNYPLEDADLSVKSERLPNVDGKIRFRKTVKKWGDAWPMEISGVVLIPGDESSARVVSASLGGEKPAVVATTSAAAPTPEQPAQATGAIDKRSLAGILGLAFLGGLILNIMPCVLPVIALKILGFVRQANEDPRRVRQLGLVYAVGVLTSFLVLAGFVIGIKQAGRAASWGMQFQNPQFLLFITVLVTLVALNLFGVFEITLSGRAMDGASGLASREGPSGAFFNGVLATILATPCTAPFLGIALGFAFASTTPVILAVFLMVGLGLALPYVILCWFPAWLKKLPKPGAWMEKFKIAMGFPMLATAVWLFSLAASRYGKPGVLYLGLLLALLSFAAWIFGEFVQRGSKRRGLAGGFAIALVIAGFTIFSRGVRADSDAIAWQKWAPEAVATARAKGKPVLVDFTADWCLTCKANKKTSIEIPTVRQKIKELGVTPLLADNTDEDPAIVAELAKYQRAGVPLVLVFPADPKAPPIVLPELLKPSLVLDALEKAAGKKSVAAVSK
jgi:thiol:disulfide interchange protein/DsbC/DsbD-like thiol-disulfide interchange protein